MRAKNLLKEKIKNNYPVLGTWQVLPSASVSNVIGAAGFDFSIIDMEHGTISFETAENMVRALESEQSTPLIRVPKNDASLILRALELGSNGIIVPQISSAKEAKKVVEAVKYHPAGKRGFSPFTRSAGYIAKDASLIAKKENVETFVGIIVEDLDGLNNLEEIVKVKGLDLIYLGKYDISQALGVPGDVNHLKVQGAIKRSTKIIKDNGLAVGSIANTEEDLRAFHELGINFIAYTADCSLLHNACTTVYENFKKTYKL